jgi:MFS transporter, DHA2 family, metal-tetracycline-proton antiporter
VLPLLTLPFYRKYLDDEKGTAGSIDFAGGVLLAGAVAMFLLSITQSSWLLLLGGAVLLILLTLRLRTAKEPFIKPVLFRNKSYTTGLAIAFAANALSFGMPFITPQFLSRLNGLSPLAIGLFMFPAALVTAVMGRRGGKLADSKGNTTLTLTAACLLLVCFMMLSTFVGMSAYWIMLFLIFGNVGQSFMGIAMSNTVSRTLSREDTGVGMGLFSMLNFISGATATSLIGKLLDAPSASWRLNPLMGRDNAVIYSNIFLVLGLGAVLVAALYYSQFAVGLKRKKGAVQGSASVEAN